MANRSVAETAFVGGVISLEFLSSSSSEPPEESLPFLMPKLRRGGGANAGFGGQPQAPSGPVRQLSLTLPFPPPLQSLPFVAPAIGFKDLVDETIPLDIQRYGQNPSSSLSVVFLFHLDLTSYIRYS